MGVTGAEGANNRIVRSRRHSPGDVLCSVENSWGHSLGVVTSFPLQLRYVTLMARRSTYPLGHPMAASLALAGFYRASRYIRCFWCEASFVFEEVVTSPTDIWQRHACASPECGNLILQKGFSAVQTWISHGVEGARSIPPAPAMDRERRGLPMPVQESGDDNEMPEEECTRCERIYARDMRIVFLPCSHVTNLCFECACTALYCDVCRRLVKGKVRAIL